MDITVGMKTKLAVSTFDKLMKAYQSQQENRVKEFLNFVDLRYDYMNIEDKVKLNEYISSQAGEEVLASFAQSVTKTSSRRVSMAIALIYCKDSEFDFNKSETLTFLSAMKEVNDDLLDFFLLTCKLDRKTEQLPYPRAGIHNRNNQCFTDKGWDEEAIFVYVNDLVRLRLLLPDPQTAATFASSGEGWAVWFGISNRSLKMASLLRKAETLLNNT
jgi:hypothetical protein